MSCVTATSSVLHNAVVASALHYMLASWLQTTAFTLSQWQKLAS